MENTMKIIDIIYKCPICGYEEHAFDNRCGLSISIPPYEGNYCLRCYAKTIHDTLPKMILKEKRENV